MSARMHLTSCETADIAEVAGHRIAAAGRHLDALIYAVEVAVKRIRRDVLPRTQGGCRNHLVGISLDLDAAADAERIARIAAARADGGV